MVRFPQPGFRYIVEGAVEKSVEINSALINRIKSSELQVAKLFGKNLTVAPITGVDIHDVSV